MPWKWIYWNRRPEMYRILNKLSFDYAMDWSADKKAKIITSLFMQFISNDVIRDSDRTKKEWKNSVQGIAAYFIQQEQEAAIYATASV
jgi:hypothetical protein